MVSRKEKRSLHTLQTELDADLQLAAEQLMNESLTEVNEHAAGDASMTCV